MPWFRSQYRSVSGFPLPCLNNCIPYHNSSNQQEPSGLPKFSVVSLPACHSLWTPADLPILTLPDALVLPSVYVKTLGVRNNLISKLYQHFRVRGHPCGLQDSLCTLRPAIVRGLPRSALDATLDTGGWLTLTRPGLSPGKIRQASWRDNVQNQGRLLAVCWIVRNGVRLRYFFILLLRPPTKFFSNQLYDKVPREVNSCLPRQNGRLPKKRRRVNT